MEIEIKGSREHKGFIVQKTTVINQEIVVLTGKNGSGKTRFLESLQNQSSVISIDGVVVSNPDVMLVGHSALNPNFGGGYDDTQFQSKVTSTLQLFDRIKHEFDLPFDANKAQQYNRDRYSGLDYVSLYKLCNSISKAIGKRPSELLHDDIILHFEEPLRNVLGVQSISTICNQYIKRKNQNSFNEWRATTKGVDVKYLSDEDFILRFGDEPWVIINKILDDIFDSKFGFDIPDENSQSYTYQAQLIRKSDESIVGVDVLSSGEKTLLWLALTLFNSQYYDSEVVNSPKVLLLDEPDAYLHPKMVEKMYRVLQSFCKTYTSIVFISTHSPTTVALAPEDSIYIVSNNTVSPAAKDLAVSELLDGVTQISISPENRRQVFVESQYDADVYQAIYTKLLSRSALLDPKISLTFVSSGPKMPAQQLKDKVKQILKISDNALIDEFVASINGIGNCSQVYGQVDSLTQSGNKFVRGIVDRDKSNKPKENVVVLAQDYAYSIENIVLDPICILLILHVEQPDLYKISDFCGKDVHWTEWLENKELLQLSMDGFIYSVLRKENKKDAIISYMSTLELKTDKDYLNHHGHQLEQKIIQEYPKLKAFSRSGKDGELKSEIVRKSMINLTNGFFIPRVFESTLAKVQK
ncbi:AAA family ATPase [Vibrio cholerae]|nr:AAA family ATPase [Vibrio cholerae]